MVIKTIVLVTTLMKIMSIDCVSENGRKNMQIIRRILMIKETIFWVEGIHCMNCMIGVKYISDNLVYSNWNLVLNMTELSSVICWR